MQGNNCGFRNYLSQAEKSKSKSQKPPERSWFSVNLKKKKKGN